MTQFNAALKPATVADFNQKTPVSAYLSKPISIPFNPMSTAHKDDGFQRLFGMLTFMRPHNTVEEEAFCNKYLGPYDPTEYYGYTTGAETLLAYVIQVGDKAASRTLFSCHVDTVHYQGGRQVPKYKDGWFYKEDGKCLGADDGAGVWLMLEMIDAMVPGTYIFHRGEEKGGIGSRGMAVQHEQFLSQFDRAVAFDRRGIESVITHQGYGRCCSDAFAEALAKAINDNIGDAHAFLLPDDTGVYTDTAEYTDLIGECTNISCGYYSEHSGNERLNADYLIALRDACIKVDWESLPTKRKPAEIDPLDKFSGYGAYGGYSGYAASNKTIVKDDAISLDALRNMSYSKIKEWVKSNRTDDVAEVICMLVDEVYALEDQLFYSQHDADPDEPVGFELDEGFHRNINGE